MTIYSTNPYVAGNPIGGEKGFFGRQDIFTWVNSELHVPGNSKTNVSFQVS